jgi:type IV secretory pathway TraG/TraD family ATPase VirD4
MYNFKPFTPLAVTNWRNENKLFGIKPADRLHHIYCLGKTGMGKSHLLINIALDDAYKGNGFCVLDPHGDTVEAILARIPESRHNDVIYFNPTDRTKLPAFNPLHNVPKEQRQLVASEMVSTFNKLFIDAWGSKLERLLRMSILTLLEYPKGTLLHIHALLVDKELRAKILQHVSDPHILSFWNKEYASYTPATQATAILPVLNKIGVLLENDILRGVFRQQQSISFEDCMNSKTIILCNLSKGIIGEDVSTVLGSFIVTALQNAAMRRASVPIEQRIPYYLFIDETQNFVSTSFASLLPQVRKFGLGLFLTNQHLEQLEPDTRSAILGNVGTLISFQVGLADAKIMAQAFYPRFTYDDFISLPRYHIYIKLLIDGTESKGFSAVTTPTYC